MTSRTAVSAAIIGASVGLLATPAVCTAQDSGGPTDREEFAAFIDEFFEANLAEASIPGGVFLMVKDSAVFLARGYGMANLERGARVDPDATVFRVGSNSKTVTAAAVLSLVDEGLLDLDTDVNRYLTSLQVPEAFGAPITLRHLLTHTAGFDERLFGQHVPLGDEPLSLSGFLAEKLTPRTVAPGRVISYNDFGTSLAGLVVEEVSGQPFADYVADRIFRPLGMSNSSFALRLPSHVEERLATAYRYLDGQYTPYEYDYIQTAPAAGLVTTAGDMGRFLLALLNGGALDGARILSDSMTAIMLERQFAHSPRLRGRAFGFVESDENGVRGVSKDGQATGFLSRIFLMPDANVAFFASINRSIFEPGPTFNRASSFHRRLTTAILDRYFVPDSAYFDLPEAPSPDPEFDATPYAGTYRAMEGSRSTIEKILFLGNELQVEDGEDGTLLIGGNPYVEIDDGEFQYAGGGPHHAAFGGAEDGSADHLFIGAGAMERAPWHDTMRTTMAVLAIVSGLLLSAVSTWPWAGVLRRRRESVESHPGRGVMLAASVLGLLFVVGFGWFFSQTDFQEFFKGIPTSIAIILGIPIVMLPLTAVTLVHAGRAWRRGLGSLAARLHYTLVGAALVLFLALLANWHMLGWQY